MTASAFGTALLAAVLLVSGPAEAGTLRLSGCHGPGDLGWERETYMTGFGEYRRCVFHPWPEPDPPIDWAARDGRPIKSPQTKILKH